MKGWIANLLGGKKRPETNDPAANLIAIKKALTKGDPLLAALPIILYLEASDNCNLRCPMCPLTMDMDRIETNDGHFEISLLEKLAQPIGSARRVFLSLGGEPMMGPDFFNIAEHVKAANPNAEILLNSNMTYMDEAAARRTIKIGVDHITFSCDGATESTYRKIRVGADFKRTIDNVERLMELKRERKSKTPRLTLQMTLMKQNRGETELMVRLAHRLGADHLVIEPLTPVFNNYKRYAEFYSRFLVPAEEIGEAIANASRLADSLGVGFSSHYLQPHADSIQRCLQPWTTFIVKANGEVRPCCGTDRLMGSLMDSTFQEIWNGEAYRDLRRRTLAGEFPDFCSACLNEGRTPTFNSDLWG